MTKIDALHYEINASWWARHVSWPWAQSLAGSYYAWKVNRKWARHEHARHIKRMVVGYFEKTAQCA
jgi:hypothetical protein